MENFEQQEAEGRDEPQAARGEDQERQNELDDKHAAGGEFQQARRQLRGRTTRSTLGRGCVRKW